MRLGQYQYNGDGKLLEAGVEYAMFEVGDSMIEAYAEGETDPVVMNKGNFHSLLSGNPERVEGATPQA